MSFQITNKFNLGSLGGLLNPISAVTGADSGQYEPKWLSGLTKSFTDKTKGQQAGQTIHTVWKTGVGFTAAYLLARAIRAIGSKAQLYELKLGKTPGGNMQQQLSTARQPMLTDAEYIDPLKGIQSKKASAALPLAAGIIGLLLGVRQQDKVADEDLGQALDVKTAENRAKLNKLLQARATMARGRITPLVITQLRDADREQMDKSASMLGDALGNITDKVTSGVKSVGSAFGVTQAYERGSAAVSLLTTALMAVAGIAAYKYGAANDEARQEYSSAEKALKQYAKQKALNKPIQRLPVNKALIDRIQGDKFKAPVVNIDDTFSANKPIAISI